MGKRKLLYLPRINPNTFLFFYSKGDSGYSYSFRDYSSGGSPSTTYARSYPYSAEQILSMATYCFDADTVDTNDINFWHQEIQKLNRRYLKKELTNQEASIPTERVSPPSRRSAFGSDPKFPIYNIEDLKSHPIKGHKTQDLERIFTTPQSEDYVTWNVLQLLTQSDPSVWWAELLRSARKNNPQFDLPNKPDNQPKLEAWCRYPAPVGYEKLRREAMAACHNPYLVDRSKNPKPVEGETEVDLVATGPDYLMFFEAKLESDISMSTTYDPSRNQIIRNIDVLLEVCGDRTPYFCMLVKDKGRRRAYAQLMETYRGNLDTLIQALPHRDPTTLIQISRRLAIIHWIDLLAGFETKMDDPVMQEVLKRIKISD